MNRLLLSAQLVQRGALRYTPAGLPVFDLALKHESTLGENGQPRKVSLDVRAVAIGDVTQQLASLALGECRTFAGFLASARNGRGIVFHIASIEPAG